MAVETAQAPRTAIQATPGVANVQTLSNLANLETGGKILDADTLPQRNEGVRELDAALRAELRQVAAAPYAGTLPGPNAGASPAASRAVLDTSAQAEVQWRQEQTNGAAEAAGKINLKGANDAQVAEQVRVQAAVIDGIKHRPVEAVVTPAESPAPSQKFAAANKVTGPDLAGVPTTDQPKGPVGYGPAAAPAAGGSAPASPVAATVEERVLQRAASPAGPDVPKPSPVQARPTGRWMPGIMADVAFEAVLTPVVEKLASLPFNGAAHSPAATGQLLGITKQTGEVIGDNLGTVSALDAAKKREAEPVAASAPAKPRPMPEAKSVQFSSAH